MLLKRRGTEPKRRRRRLLVAAGAAARGRATAPSPTPPRRARTPRPRRLAARSPLRSLAARRRRWPRRSRSSCERLAAGGGRSEAATRACSLDFEILKIQEREGALGELHARPRALLFWTAFCAHRHTFFSALHFCSSSPGPPSSQLSPIKKKGGGKHEFKIERFWTLLHSRSLFEPQF